MSGVPDYDPASLVGRIAALDEQGALDTVKARATAGDDPLAIIEDCQLGMRYVGDHYQSGRYFISGLIMAGEIFRETMEILQPRLADTPARSEAGTVLLCTVQGDIHDIGKSIVETLLRSYGFVVHDLGVDVPAAEVARQARALQPDIVGLSGLLGAAVEGMKSTVAELRRAAPDLGRPLPVIIGGGQINEQARAWTGADLWTNDAARGVKLIRAAVAAGRG
ncbi:MAG TPA: cobalamin-dependent protein [Thermoleophilia bacterium]